MTELIRKFNNYFRDRYFEKSPVDKAIYDLELYKYPLWDMDNRPLTELSFIANFPKRIQDKVYYIITGGGRFKVKSGRISRDLIDYGVLPLFLITGCLFDESRLCDCNLLVFRPTTAWRRLMTDGLWVRRVT
jgi:hypothetical protein